MDKKIKKLEERAKAELERKLKFNEKAEIVYLPVVIVKNENGDVCSVTSFTNKLF